MKDNNSFGLVIVIGSTNIFFPYRECYTFINISKIIVSGSISYLIYHKFNRF